VFACVLEGSTRGVGHAVRARWPFLALAIGNSACQLTTDAGPVRHTVQHSGAHARPACTRTRAHTHTHARTHVHMSGTHARAHTQTHLECLACFSIISVSINSGNHTGPLARHLARQPPLRSSSSRASILRPLRARTARRLSFTENCRCVTMFSDVWPLAPVLPPATAPPQLHWTSTSGCYQVHLPINLDFWSYEMALMVMSA
jgi:hypothetical protein